MRKKAFITDCGEHRLWLSRAWGREDSRLLFIMLNPSTADADIDDPTIRRCMAFAKREGYSGIEVVNLYSYRATSPLDLWAQPEHRRNHWLAYAPILMVGLRADRVVCAWGADPRAKERAAEVHRALAPFCDLVCLGTTKSGAPRHPLYVKGDQPLLPWRMEG